MAEMWDSVAPAWEANADAVDAHLGPATTVLLDAAELTGGDAVIDLATGTGGAGLAAAPRVGPTGRVVLTDAAPEMVAAAARRSAGQARVETLTCDQDAIDAPDASFDAVISRLGLMFAPDPADAVREAVRVLRSGGRFAAATWGRREENPWLGLVFDAVGAQFGVAFPPPAMPGPFSLDDPERLRVALEEGGLHDVRVQAVDSPMTVASIDAWWAIVHQIAGPLALALAGLESAVRDEIRERALAAGAAAARPADGGIELGGSVLVASGRRP